MSDTSKAIDEILKKFNDDKVAESIRYIESAYLAGKGSPATQVPDVAKAVEQQYQYVPNMPGLLGEVERDMVRQAAFNATYIVNPGLRQNFFEATLNKVTSGFDWMMRGAANPEGMNPEMMSRDVTFAGPSETGAEQQRMAAEAAQMVGRVAEVAGEVPGGLVDVMGGRMPFRLLDVIDRANQPFDYSAKVTMEELATLQGLNRGMSYNQMEGFAADVARGFGQSITTLATVPLAFTTGGASLPVTAASLAMVPGSAYAGGALEYMEELDQRRADAAAAGQPLPEFSVSDLQERAAVAAIAETGTETLLSFIGAQAIGAVGKGARLAKSAKLPRAVLRPLVQAGEKPAAQILSTRAGTVAAREFAALTEGTGVIKQGFIAGVRAVASRTPAFVKVLGISGLEEGTEELVSGLIQAPWTYKPFSEDVKDALYSFAVGGASGGLGASPTIGVVGTVRAYQNVRDSMRPESDAERVLRQAHSEATKRKVDWTQGLDDTQKATVATALDSVNGMTPQERGTYVRDLSDRKAEIVARAESLIGRRQVLDVAANGINEQTPNADEVRSSIDSEIAAIDVELKQLSQDHLIADATHTAVADKVSEMPSVVEQSTPDEVLADMGKRSGTTLEKASAPRGTKQVMRDMAALGMNVVWFRPTSGTFNPAVHSMRTRGTIYLNANMKPAQVRAAALEEAFHDVQMFRPQLAQLFTDMTGYMPVYREGAKYASRQAENARNAALDTAALAQAAASVDRMEGVAGPSMPALTARAGATRLEQEGAANAFAAAATAFGGGSLIAPFVEFAAKMGFMGREVRAAGAVIEAVRRAAAMEKANGTILDPALSPLGRTLLYLNNVNYDLQNELDSYESYARKKEEKPPPPPTAREIREAAARRAKVGELRKVVVGARLRKALIGEAGMTEAARLDMARRFSAAAASIYRLNLRSLTPAEYVAGQQRNKGVKTLTPYNLEEIANPKETTINDKPARVTLEPYGIPGLDVAYMIKRVEFLDKAGGTVTGERYDEAVGLYSNEGDITDVIPPILLHAISQYPSVEMRMDAYDVLRPGQLKGNGKLPSFYKAFGAVTTEYFDFDPQYLEVGPGETLDGKLAALEAYWASEGWVAERDQYGRVQNYPGVWFAKVNLSEAERRSVRDGGIAAFAANPSRLEDIAAGRVGSDYVVRTALTGERPEVSLQRRDEGNADVNRQAGGRVPPRDPDIFVGTRRRVSLVKLSLALQEEFESLSTADKGRLLSASQWLPKALTLTKEEEAGMQAGRKQQIDAADAALKAADKRVDDLRKKITAEIKRLESNKDATPADRERVMKLRRTKSVETLVSIGDSASAELRALIANLNEQRELKDVLSKRLERKKDVKRVAKDMGLVGAAKLAVNKRIAAKEKEIVSLRTRINEISVQLDSWIADEPLAVDLINAIEARKEAENNFASTKQFALGDLMADRGINSMRVAMTRKYDVAELHGLLDSFAHSVVGWMDRFTSKNAMPEDIQQMIVSSLAEDLKYAATKIGRESALEWYDRIINDMWSEASRKYKALANKNGEDRIVFALCLAITSQGEKVEQNALLARSLYEAWVANGRKQIVVPSTFNARHEGAMVQNIGKANELLAEFKSWKKVSAFLLEKRTTAEHNKILRTSKLSDKVGEIKDAADDEVYMSSVLGPKIGSFFNNLYGKFDTLTADVWFTRTISRVIGNLRRADATAMNSATALIREVINTSNATLNDPNASDEAKRAAQYDLSLIPADALTNPDALEAAAKKFNKDFASNPDNRIVVGNALKLREKSSMEAALVRYAKAVDASSAAPDSNYIRSLMRDLVNRAIVQVREETGLEYTVANAQAGLWYVEKELYAYFGAAPDPAGQDYREAMRSAMDADLKAPEVIAKMSEAVAANDKAAEQVDAGESDVVSEDAESAATESFARHSAHYAEMDRIGRSLASIGRFAQEDGIDLFSFSRVSPDILEKVAAGELVFCGAGEKTDIPVTMTHGTSDKNADPFRYASRSIKTRMSFSDQIAVSKTFGTDNIIPMYIVARNRFLLDCKGSNWSDIRVDMLPVDIRTALENQYVGGVPEITSVDEIAIAAFELGYDVSEFANVLDNEYVHTEVVVTHRRNLVSPATGETLHDMDVAQWRQGGTPIRSQLKIERKLGGSTGAMLATDPNGKQWVIKHGASIQHLMSEYLHLELYRLFGIPVPRASIDQEVKEGTTRYMRPVMITEYIDGKTLAELQDEADANPNSIASDRYEIVLSRLRRDFAADVMLRNWDVLGMSLDNVVVDNDTLTPYRIDVGGSGDYRAQGGRKDSPDFENPLRVLNGMLINPVSTSVANTLATVDRGQFFESLVNLIAANESIAEEAPLPTGRTINFAALEATGNSVAIIKSMANALRGSLKSGYSTKVDTRLDDAMIAHMRRRFMAAIDGKRIMGTLAFVSSLRDNNAVAGSMSNIASLLPGVPQDVETDASALAKKVAELQELITKRDNDALFAQFVAPHADGFLKFPGVGRADAFVLGELASMADRAMAAERARGEEKPTAAQAMNAVQKTVERVQELNARYPLSEPAGQIRFYDMMLDSDSIATADTALMLFAKSNGVSPGSEQYGKFALETLKDIQRREVLHIQNGLKYASSVQAAQDEVNDAVMIMDKHLMRVAYQVFGVEDRRYGLQIENLYGDYVVWLTSESQSLLNPTHPIYNDAKKKQAANDATISYARADDNPTVIDLQKQIDTLRRQMRDVENMTAAARANALREVKMLERKLSTAHMIAAQKTAQANRAKARLVAETEYAEKAKAAAAETINTLEGEIDQANAALRTLRQELREAKSEIRNVDQRVEDVEKQSQRAIDWAYAIGRHAGLAAGEIVGQQKGRRVAAKLDTRIETLEKRIELAKDQIRLAKQEAVRDAKNAERAVNLAYQMGLRSGVVQGMMRGRQQVLRRMMAREDTLQRQIERIKTLAENRVTNVITLRNTVQQIALDAARMLPSKLRGPLATKIAQAKSLRAANRLAVEATKLAINNEVAQSLAAIARVRKQMNKRGMRIATRNQIEALLARAEGRLRASNNRRLQATLGPLSTGAGGTQSRMAVVNAVSLYSQVVDAALEVEQAVAIYTAERAAWVQQRDQRVARYAALKQQIVANMAGRRRLAVRERADLPPRQSLATRISLANSDIYTLMLELEGKGDGVINELLRAAMAGKGEAALEHARIVQGLAPALLAAGYTGLDDYVMRNGLSGQSLAQTVSVAFGGQDYVIARGVALSIAAMDDETLDLFPTAPTDPPQAIKFATATTTTTVYPTRADIVALRASLTPGERALIMAMKDVLETQVRDRAMDAIYAVEGDQPPIVQNYWPRVRESQFEGETASVMNAAGALVRGALTSVGFSNARLASRLPLVYSDAFVTWDRHVQVALDMIHMAQPYRDAATVLSDPDVVRDMDTQMGAGTAESVRAIFSNGVGATARTHVTIIDKLTNNVTSAILSLSPTTNAKVIVGGTVRLMSEMSAPTWLRGVARSAKYANRPKTWAARVQEVHALNGYFMRRHQMHMRSIISGTLSDNDRVRVMVAARGFAAAMRKSGQNAVAKNITDSLNAIQDANTNANMVLSSLVDALRYMDQQIMLVAVEARLAEVEAEGILTGQAALREAASRAEFDFRRSQNASDEFDDTVFAAVSRVKGATSWRSFFPFSSDPLKARNQIRRAWLSGERRIETAFAIGANATSSTVISALNGVALAYIAKVIAASFGGEDEPTDKEDKEFQSIVKGAGANFAIDLSKSVFGYVGIAFASALEYALYRRVPGTALIGRPVEQTIMEVQSAQPTEKAEGQTWRYFTAALALSQLAGIPAYSMFKFVERMVPSAKQKASKPPLTPAERIQQQVERLRQNLTPEAMRERAMRRMQQQAVPRLPSIGP